MNFQTLSTITSELSTALSGARIERMYDCAGMENSISLVLRKKGKNHSLLISPDRSFPRIYVIGNKPDADTDKHPFTQYVKPRITGGQVTSIALLNLDRIVEIRISCRGPEYRLLVELMGPASNLIFTDSAGKILALYYPVQLGLHARRPLLPGIQYELPAKMVQAGGKNTLDNANPKPGTPHPAEPFSGSRAAEIHYDRIMRQKRFDTLRARLLASAKKAFTKAARKKEALFSDHKTLSHPETHKLAGDLLLANLNSIRTGMRQVQVLDYTGNKVLIPLDPDRSPQKNAEKYFKKYKKGKSGLNIITERLRETEQEMTLLQTLLSRLENAPDEPALVAIRSSLQENGYLPGDRTRTRKTVNRPALPAVRKVLYREWQIMIGKNASANDYITTRIARPHDLWLHAEGLAGSHVLVRNPDNREIPPDVLAKAASLAAFYSKGRSGGKVAVTFAAARFVKKPKGAKAGLVTLLKRKTIMVIPEQA